jgi:CheY-like chemotaxis protein
MKSADDVPKWYGSRVHGGCSKTRGIIMDINVPKIDGIEATKQIKAARAVS